MCAGKTAAPCMEALEFRPIDANVVQVTSHLPLLLLRICLMSFLHTLVFSALDASRPKGILKEWPYGSLWVVCYKMAGFVCLDMSRLCLCYKMDRSLFERS